MISGDTAIIRLCDEEAQVSAHYVIEEDGRVFALVPEDRRAWHAGISFWRGHTDINSRSVGIELVHPGHVWGYRPFAEAQIASLIALAHKVLKRHTIPARNVVGHHDIAPNRKEDPGELFPWRRLAEHGVGLWPGTDGATAKSDPSYPVPSLLATQQALAAFGYSVDPTGTHDLATRNAVVAFQRRFRPARLDGVFDRECKALLADLLEQIGCEALDGFLG